MSQPIFNDKQFQEVLSRLVAAIWLAGRYRNDASPMVAGVSGALAEQLSAQPVAKPAKD
ncbi:hypothetical protein ACNKHQ_19820 [Shigella flexneri]